MESLNLINIQIENIGKSTPLKTDGLSKVSLNTQIEKITASRTKTKNDLNATLIEEHKRKQTN